MNKLKQAYIAIDLHSKHSVIGYTNQDGKLMGLQQVQTSSKALIKQLAAIKAKRKYLTIEQTNMAFAMAQKLSSYVDKLIICEPRHNKLISQSATKNDRSDTINLCKLLRLGELKPVWRPKKLGKRRLLHQQIKEYHRLNKTLTANKNQLKASLRHWGLPANINNNDYREPSEFLASIDNRALREELAAKIAFIQTIKAQKAAQIKRVRQTGRDYPEITEFQKMTGVATVGAHTFSAVIQTPHRFDRREQLIRFCQLGVAKRSSDGTQYGREHLDKAGHSCLKQVSYVAWETAQKSDNEVNRFYQASLKRSDNATNARLNTQRKILITLWTIWKHNRTYRPDKFCSGNGNST